LLNNRFFELAKSRSIKNILDTAHLDSAKSIRFIPKQHYLF